MVKSVGYLMVFAVGLCILIGTFAYSQGMSELNLGSFEKKQKSTSVDTVKSPFTPAKPSPNELMVEDLYLTGVAVGSGKNYALISGHVVSEGDSVAGLKVKAITKEKVILQNLDNVHTLRIEGGL